MIPSPIELIYFSEAARELNLSRAARNLFISQPSLSLAIQRLEKLAGTQLLIRHTRGVTLTPAGKKILRKIHPLLQLWESTKLEAMASHQQVEGVIRIGCHSTVAVFFDKILSFLLGNYPNLQIHFKHDLTTKTIEGLLDLSIDLGIVFNPPHHSELIIHKLNKTEITFWKNYGKSSIQDINSKNVVLICNPDIPQTSALLKKTKLPHLKSARILRSNSVEAIANLTASGCGIGILASSYVQSTYPDILSKLPNMPSLCEDVCLIYRRENRNIKAIQTIISLINQVPWKEKTHKFHL